METGVQLHTHTCTHTHIHTERERERERESKKGRKEVIIMVSTVQKVQASAHLPIFHVHNSQQDQVPNNIRKYIQALHKTYRRIIALPSKVR